MSHSERLKEMVNNMLSVLKIENVRSILFSVFRIEKNAILGMAAEVVFMAILMLAVLALAIALTFLGKRI